MAWLGTVISIVVWITRAGGIIAAVAATLNGQATVVNAHAVGSWQIPDVLNTVYTILAAGGLSATWLVPLKKVTDILKGIENVAPSPAPSPAPAPAPLPLPQPNGGGSLLSSIPLLELMAAGEAAVTWLSTKMPDKPVDFRFQLGGFEFWATVKPVESSATLPQLDLTAEAIKELLEHLKSQPMNLQVPPADIGKVNPGLAMPAAG